MRIFLAKLLNSRRFFTAFREGRLSQALRQLHLSPPPPACPGGAPRWRRLAHLALPGRQSLRAWLGDRGSLTAQLLRLSGGNLQVRILRQRWAIPSALELRALGLSRPTLTLVREVVLQGRGQDWVYARSLLPATSLVGPLRHLRKQDTSPLGAFLFSQPQLARSPMEVALLQPEQLPQQLARGQRLWGRRSIFHLNARPLLVSEVFLPAFAQQLAQRPPCKPTGY